MQITVKEINDTDDNKKRVSFQVISDNNQIYIIDKRIDKTDNKTNEDYVNEAYALAKPEIDSWVAEVTNIGKTINLETGLLNAE